MGGGGADLWGFRAGGANGRDFDEEELALEEGLEELEADNLPCDDLDELELCNLDLESGVW